MDERESKRAIRTFGLASFLNDMGSDMIYPIWPLFVTNVLKANMSALGFIDGLGEAIVSLSQVVSGYISDRIRKRKIFIWPGYLMSAISRVGYAFSSIWQHLIPFKILDRAGKIRGAPRDAEVADLSTDENRGKNFGFLRAMDNLGAVCGILLCLLLFNKLGYKNLFLIAAIPSIIGATLIFIFVKERREGITKISKSLTLKDLNRNLILFLILSTIFALGAFSYSFLLIFAKELGFEVKFIPILYLIFTLVASLTALPFGRLSDKLGRKSILTLSFAFWILICIGFAFIINISFIIKYWIILIVFVLYGLHKGSLEPVQRTIVSELSPVKYRASILGTYQMVIGLSALPASFIAGILWDKIGMSTPFIFSLILTILAIFILFFVKEKRKPI